MKTIRAILACVWVLWGTPGVFAQATQVDLRTQSKSVDFSGFSSTKPFRTGTVLPATCATGDTFFKNDALPGQTLYGCVATNTWNLINPPPGTSANFSASFTSASVVTILGTTHGLVSANLILECYDNASPANRLLPTAVTVHATTFDVVVTFASAQTGRCVLNGYGGGGGGGGSVSSVFGRTGAVVATSGDYTFSEIAGTVPNSQVAAGVDATKIAAGTVTNTAYGFLANVTSDAQAQLNNKAALTHSHTALGDVTGDLAATTVARIQSRSVAAVAPANGQAIVWNASLSRWEPQNQAGTGTNATQLQSRNVAATAPGDGQALVWTTAGNTWQPGTVAGGGGAGMAAQLGDLQVTRLSGTQLRIGANCSAATPCNVAAGDNVYQFSNAVDVTLSTGTTGTIRLGVAPDGTRQCRVDAITVTSNPTITCSAATTFPADWFQIAQWSVSSSQWAASGTDWRAAYRRDLYDVAAGGDLTKSASNLFAVNSATIPSYSTGTTVPSSCTSARQLFIKTNATAGQQLYQCKNGSTFEQVGIVTVNAGSGVAVANGSSGSPTVSADTAVVLSRATDQAGTDRYCASANGSDSYTCNLTPALTGYTPGMILILNPDVNNSGAASVNVDGLGAVALKTLGGGTLVDPANNDIDADGIYQLAHDGTVFVVTRIDGGIASATEAFVELREEFLSGNGIDGQAGQLGWRFGAVEAGTATFARQSSEVGAPGLHRLSTSAGSGDDAVIYFGNSTGDFNDLLQSEWDLTWIVRPVTATSVAVRAGLSETITTASPANGMWLRFSTAAGDTNWTYEMRRAGVSDTFATSTAPSTTVFAKLRIWRRTAGVGGNPTIFMTLNGGQQRTWCASGCNHSTANIPTVSIKPQVMLETQTTAARSIDADFFSFRQYGLVR